MKKAIFTILTLAFIPFATAKTTVNIVKPLAYGEASDSGDGFEVKTSKGTLYIYSWGMDEKSANILYQAIKSKGKSCVKVVENESMQTTITKVKCPQTLKPVK